MNAKESDIPRELPSDPAQPSKADVGTGDIGVSGADVGLGIADPDRPHYIQQIAPWLLILAAVIVYANSLRGEFILDSIKHIHENSSIRQLWPPDYLRRSNRPIVWASLAINYAIGQTDPVGYHLFNLVIHVLASITLLGIIRRALLSPVFEKRFERAAPWLALAIAMVWLVHPLNTQAVTYVIQRSTSMMGLFYLLTLYCAIRCVDSPRPVLWLIAAALACALGVGSKFNIITVPVIVLIYDWTFLQGRFFKMMRRRWVWIAVLLVMVLGVLRYLGAGKQLFGGTSVGFGAQGASPMNYLISQSKVILHYLRLSFWPDQLCLDYAWPPAKNLNEVWMAGLVIIGLLAATFWGVWRRSALGFLGAWFFVTLTPSSSVFPLWDLAAEQRMYLALIVPVAIVIVLAYLALDALVNRKALSSAAAGPLAAIFVILLLVPLGLRTYIRNVDYHDRLSMWQKIASQRPNNIRAHNHCGVILTETGDFDRAIYHLRIAVDRGQPKMQAYARVNLARALVRNGQPAEAIVPLEKVLKENPKNPLAHQTMAESYRALGQTAKATRHYYLSMYHRPRNPVYRFTYGWQLLELGRNREAVVHLKLAVEGSLDSSWHLSALGLALVRTGDTDGAKARYAQAIDRLDQLPQASYALAQKNLAQLAQALGNDAPAQTHWYQTASMLAETLYAQPDNSHIPKPLALALIRLHESGPIVGAMVSNKDTRPTWARALAETAWEMWIESQRDSAIVSTQSDIDAILLLAQQACAITEQDEPHALIALSAAYLAKGQKAKAAAIMKKPLFDPASADQALGQKLKRLSDLGQDSGRNSGQEGEPKSNNDNSPPVPDSTGSDAPAVKTEAKDAP
jgi:Tfp pilus assembly protein PilF